MMAHYLMFVLRNVESIFLWIGYVIARWMVTPPQLANVMLLLYSAPTTAPGASRIVRPAILRMTANALTLWLITRYGYHFSIFFLIERTIHFVCVIFLLFNLIRPGRYKEILCVHCSLANHWKNMIAGTMCVRSVNQWYLTLCILTSVSAIPFYWGMFAHNPMPNFQELLFLIIPTGIYV